MWATNRIKSIRKSKGMTIRELSVLSAIPISTLGGIESGVIHPHLIQIHKIAQSLKTDADLLGCSPLEYEEQS